MLVIAGSHELLGNEIHAVMKAGDDAQVGGAKELEDFRTLKMPHYKRNRGVAFVTVASVNLADKTLGLLVQVAICRELRSRRSRDLEEDKTTDPFGVAGEKCIDSAQTVENTFGVVEAFDAHAYPYRVAQAEAGPNRATARDH